MLPLILLTCTIHCVKSVCIRSFSEPYFPAFGLSTEYFSLPIQSECGKIRTRETPNANIFHAVILLLLITRGVFRTLSNLWDRAFRKNSYRLKDVNYFRKKLHLRCLKDYWIWIYLMPVPQNIQAQWNFSGTIWGGNYCKYAKYNKSYVWCAFLAT